MRKSVFVATVSLVFFMGCKLKKNPESEEKVFQYTNIIANELGAAPGEIVLTFDDGPGPRALELANFLLKEKIPTTFFMVGEVARERLDVVKKISEMKNADGTLAFIVANHSMTHDESSLSTAYVPEVSKADAILAPFIKTDFFFRPPYGNLLTATWLTKNSWESAEAFKQRVAKARAQDRLRVDKLNSTSMKKYIGPILWNVGTSMAGGFSADWACWEEPGTPAEKMKRCTDGYLAEFEKRREQGQGAVVLCHDIHSETVDMWMGTGNTKGRSLLKILRDQRHFNFIALNKYKDKIEKLKTLQQSANGYVSVVPVEQDGKKFLNIAADNADHVTVKIGATLAYDGSLDQDVTVPLEFPNVRGSSLVDIVATKNGEHVGSLAMPIRL